MQNELDALIYKGQFLVEEIRAKLQIYAEPKSEWKDVVEWHQKGIAYLKTSGIPAAEEFIPLTAFHSPEEINILLSQVLDALKELRTEESDQVEVERKKERPNKFVRLLEVFAAVATIVGTSIALYQYIG